MSTARTVEHLLVQARSCRDLGAPFTAALLERAARDVRRGGPVSRVLAGHEQDPGPSALGLRFVGAVHRLVLSGAAPDLAAAYPREGAPGDPARAVRVLPVAVAAHEDRLRGWLGQAPQTNEVGRAAPLWGGLLRLLAEGLGAGTGVGGRPIRVRLRELGSSAGLLLAADRVRYEAADGSTWGPPTSPVVLDRAWDRAPWAWAPGPPPDVEVVDREGADPAPLDPRDPEDVRRLASFVWPEQAERVERLRGALRLAAEGDARVLRQGAADLVAALHRQDGAVTVVWHSVVRQYLDRAERDAVDDGLARLGAGATPLAPLVHLAFEPLRLTAHGEHRFVVAASVWDGRAPGPVTRVLGGAHPHGVPVTWWRRSPALPH